MKRLKTFIFFLPMLALFFATVLPQAQAHSAYHHCHWKHGKKYCHGYYKKKVYKPRRHCWYDRYGRLRCRYY